MTCPKCGFDQPDSPDCAACGIVIAKFRGGVTSQPIQPGEQPPAPIADPPVGQPAPVTGYVDGGATYVDKKALLDKLEFGSLMSETFSVFFQREFAEQALRSLVEPTNRLLDEPEATGR